MITASMDIDGFIVQLSTLMAAEKSSETNSRTRRLTGDDDNHHDYRPRVFDPANERNRIRSRYWVEHHSYESIECDHQPEKQQWTKCVAGNDDYDDYRIRPYQREKSNTIPTSQLTAIISQRTYDQSRDLTPESAIPRTEGKRRLRVGTVATTFLQIEQSASTSIVMYMYNSSNLEEARWTAKTTKANGLIPTIPIPGIQNRSSPIAKPSGGSRANYKQRCVCQRKSTKAERQTGKALAAAAGTTKPTVVLNIHGNMQRVKAQIDCGAMSIFLSPSLLRKPKLPYEPAFTSTLAWWWCM